MQRLVLAGLPLAALAAGPAHAHVGPHTAAVSIFDVLPLAGIAAGSAGYALGVYRLRSKMGVKRVLGTREVAAFAAGILSLLVALESPLDRMSEELFSAHMVQHLALMLLAAPLIVRGRPLLAFLWAVPRALRKAGGRWWASSWLSRAAAWLVHPLSLWIAFCGVFVFWHLPGPYGWALQHDAIHMLEHVTFFLSAFGFWAVVIEPAGRRRLGHGASILFVGTAAVLGGLPGALMILAQKPFYAEHLEGAARWGLSPVEDQQLAGLLMWIPAGFVYLAAVAWLFLDWLREADAGPRSRRRRLASSTTLSLLLLLSVGACEPPETDFAKANIDGNPEEGAAEIVGAGCGSCHEIPGIEGADGRVGPPLTAVGDRIYIAGLLRNTPENLVYWIRFPQEVVPGNAMPNMGLSEEQARDIAAYLYTLQ